MYKRQAWGGALLKGETGNRETEILNALDNIANEKEAKILDVALAWLRQKHDNTGISTVTILGPRTEEQLADNLNSLAVTLSEQEIELLNKLSDFDLGYPHTMISESQKNIFGASTGLVDTKRKI